MKMINMVTGKYEECVEHCSELFGGEDFFEFSFSFVPLDERFREIDRFLWESRHCCTRFKNRYIGNTVIDFSDWDNRCPNAYFDAFVYFLLDNSEDHDLVFIASGDCCDKVIERLREAFDIKLIDIGGEVTGFTAKKPMTIGFDITDEAGR